MENKYKPCLNSEEDDGQYPWDDVDSSRADKKLQKEHPISEAKEYMKLAGACPKCGKKPEDLDWFYFSSPEETWNWLCGDAGWMNVCDDCHLQVNYFEECVS